MPYLDTSKLNIATHRYELDGDFVALMVHRFDCPFYANMYDSACKLLIRNSYYPIVHPTYGSSRDDLKLIDFFLERPIKGLIYQGDLLDDGDLQEQLTKYPQIVVMGRRVPGFEERCVYLDNDLGARIAARHLIENGHTDIAMITGPRFKQNEVPIRTEAFINELEENGLSIPTELIIHGDFLYHGGLVGIRKLLNSNRPFTAVFAQNDAMAVGVRAGCEEHGLRVPEDISIIGFDDLADLAQNGSPKLTTILQSTQDMGSRTAQVLHEILRGSSLKNPLPSHYGRIVPELISRESVALLQKPQRKSNDINSSLTTREAECLEWIANGKTSCEIAIILSIAESTVNFHLKNALAKLDASNRVHAVAKAIKYELISV